MYSTTLQLGVFVLVAGARANGVQAQATRGLRPRYLSRERQIKVFESVSHMCHGHDTTGGHTTQARALIFAQRWVHRLASLGLTSGASSSYPDTTFVFARDVRASLHPSGPRCCAAGATGRRLRQRP